MAQQSEDLLKLLQVLEEEYVSLHGPLPPSYYQISDTDEKTLEKKRLAELYRLMPTLPQPRSAICLSGGGIRSGTFALGVLQGLARHNLLNKFHYLSTVSGGGYIGSWLTAWIYRDPGGLPQVTEQLHAVNPTDTLSPEPEPLRHLREYSNFITPRFSLLSADVWTFIAIYLRNLLLNWLVLIPLMLAVLAIPRFCLAVVRASAPAWCKWLFLIGGLLTSGLAIGYMGINRPSAGDSLKAGSYWRTHNTQGNFLCWCLLPLTLSAVCLTTFWAWLHNPATGVVTPLPPFQWLTGRSILGFMLCGIVIYLIGWGFYSLNLRFKPKELIHVLVIGIVGGGLFWLAATKVFSIPVSQPVLRIPQAAIPGYAFSAHLVTEAYVCFAAPLFLTIFLLAVTLFVGVSSRQVQRTALIEDEDREWLARFGGWVLIAVLAWSVFSVDVVFGSLALWWSPKIISGLGGISGLLALLGGYSAKTPASDTQAAKAGWQAILLTHGLAVGAVAFIIVFVATLSLGTTLLISSMFAESLWNRDVVPPPFGWFHLIEILHYTPFWLAAGLIIVLAGLGLGMAKVINLNKFSLHAGYRNRLIRAFLGASRTQETRKPNPFTGFDPSDNIQMHELRPGLLRDTSFVKQDMGLTRLVDRLYQAREQDRTTDITACLKSLLSVETKELLANHVQGSSPTQSLKADLIEDLNRIIETTSLYHESPFAQLQVIDGSELHRLVDYLWPEQGQPLEEGGVGIRELLTQRVLSPETQAEIETQPGAKDEIVRRRIVRSLRDVYRLALNRLLLDRAYLDEIMPCQYPLPPYRLLHVVNTALNLVGGHNLAWQERKAEAFSVSPLHCGSLDPELGYRRSRQYGGVDGISLGTAITISGAAANSNMGYCSSSSAVTFMLTLFNARLGWWLGNPGPTGEAYYHLGYPKSAIYPIVTEALGLTDADNAYVLLSDGGHFENLGLYEMVLRRCRCILVVDGGRDEAGQFADLGNAVRKIRIDFGIPIDFPYLPIYPRDPEDQRQGKYCAVGRICYSSVDGTAEQDDGVLLYIKPAFYGDEPRDIFNYAQTNPQFPHESTADQWFDEPQFESHRMLGSYIMDVICGPGNAPLTLSDLVNKAYGHFAKDPSPPVPLNRLEAWLRQHLPAEAGSGTVSSTAT
jgi:hypothetical protein